MNHLWAHKAYKDVNFNEWTDVTLRSSYIITCVSRTSRIKQTLISRVPNSSILKLRTVFQLNKTKPNSSEDNANFYNNITTGMYFFF